MLYLHNAISLGLHNQLALYFNCKKYIKNSLNMFSTYPTMFQQIINICQIGKIYKLTFKFQIFYNFKYAFFYEAIYKGVIFRYSVRPSMIIEHEDFHPYAYNSILIFIS